MRTKISSLILTILIITILISPAAISADLSLGWIKMKLGIENPTHQCAIQIKNTPECTKGGMPQIGHICQLYRGYNELKSVKDQCDFCIKRSRATDHYDKNCVEAIIEPSHFAGEDLIGQVYEDKKDNLSTEDIQKAIENQDKNKRKLGCTNKFAKNYDKKATADDGSCILCPNDDETHVGEYCVRCNGQFSYKFKCIDSCPEGTLEHSWTFNNVWFEDSWGFGGTRAGLPKRGITCMKDPCYYYKKEAEKRSWLGWLITKATETESDYKYTLEEVSGKVYVERGVELLLASSEFEIKSHDTIIVQEGASATLRLGNQGSTKFPEKTKFTVPKIKPRGTKLGFEASYAICRMKHTLKGDSFELDTPTATAGVRG